MSKNYKDFVKNIPLKENVEQEEINEDLSIPCCISPGDIVHIAKFAEQLSSAFQPKISKVLEKIEVQLNKFGYSLGELESVGQTEDEGMEDFVVYNFATGEEAKNLFLTLKWKNIGSKIYDYQTDKLEFSVTLTLNEIDPEDFDTLFTDEELEFVDEYQSDDEDDDEGEDYIGESQKPYVSMDSSGSHVLDAEGKICKTFSKKEFGAEHNKKATEYLKKNYEKILNEAFEQLDEISKAALGSYVKKANKDATVAAQLQGSSLAQAQAPKSKDGYNMDDKHSRDAYVAGVERENIKHNKNADDYKKIRDKREKGVSKATDKIVQKYYTVAGKDDKGNAKTLTISADDNQKAEIKAKEKGLHSVKVKLKEETITEQYIVRSKGKEFTARDKTNELRLSVNSDGSIDFSIMGQSNNDETGFAHLTIPKNMVDDVMVKMMDHYIQNKK